MKINLPDHILQHLHGQHDVKVTPTEEYGMVDVEFPDKPWLFEWLLLEVYLHGHASGCTMTQRAADKDADRRGRQFAAELAARDKGGHHAT